MDQCKPDHQQNRKPSGRALAAGRGQDGGAETQHVHPSMAPSRRRAAQCGDFKNTARHGRNSG
eukprot:CAMPEP_0204518304 /NCGR_PEP_ID=MMETSP0661-20131031/4129_1 /ASSEMBLY_ACC=CAM_ASM_000606 /TAXON_ID=109239 /ORGANISM="Alexandrium margalefi, Strain AMGDE01CS-322" /LENGTH=62 /DNA_ID=CAMNT_0051523743 /DNA_START=114 /DNA_END=298 /DNA_ORIENTATION=+